MKKNNTVGIILGLLFLVIGVGYLAEVVGLLDDFTIFFDGWWTLFIIVPCFCGLLGKDGDKVGYLIGIAIGLFLLLAAQDIIGWDKLWPLAVAVICLLIGVNLILPKKQKPIPKFENHQASGTGAQTDRFDRGTQTTEQPGETVFSDAEVIVEPAKEYKENAGTEEKVICSAVFAGRDIRVDNSYFYGADLSALFGGIDMNLKNALIVKDVTIDVKAIFGGVDLIMPPNVRVVVDVNPILGGVDNGARAPLGADEHTPTVYIRGTCLFGGVDVK